MNEPITRDENTDTLTEFRRVFHEEIIRHRARRLDLFLRLEFPDEAGDEDGWPTALNQSKALESAAPVTVGQHKLFNPDCPLGLGTAASTVASHFCAD